MTNAVPPAVDPGGSVRERVVQAARLLLYGDGPAVSVDAIVRAAGVAKPSVYAHFGSKEALVAEILEQAVDDYLAVLGERLRTARDEGGGSLVAIPFELLAEGLPDARYRGCLCLNVAAAAPTDPAPAAALSRLNHEVLRVFTDLAEAEGVHDPAALAQELLVLFNGAKALGVVDPSGAPATHAKAAALALLAAHRVSRS